MVGCGDVGLDGGSADAARREALAVDRRVPGQRSWPRSSPDEQTRSDAPIGYNRLHLQAELPVRVAISLNVFQRVFQFDAMALQKGIDFDSRLVTHQLAQLGSRNLAFAERG